MPEEGAQKNIVQSFLDLTFRAFDGPVTAFREKVVVPLQSKNKFAYYHRKLRRVPDIDECDTDDFICFQEANLQYHRDKLVEQYIVNILRQRRLECEHWYGPDAEVKCKKVVDDYLANSTNWFIKYGELGAAGNVVQSYMKQKHRLIWERRHGKIYGPEFDSKYAEPLRPAHNIDRNN